MANQSHETGWQSPIDSAANAPTDELDEGRAWPTAASAAPKREFHEAAVDGWSHPKFPETDANDGWGTPYKTGQEKPILADPEDYDGDDWVDQEERRDYEPEDQYIRDYRPGPQSQPAHLQLLGIGAVIIFLLAIVALKLTDGPEEKELTKEAVAQKKIEDALASGQLLMTSAKESIEKKQYEMAASQIRSAITDFEEAGASEDKIVEAKTLLGSVFMLHGDYREAHDIFVALDPRPEEQLRTAQKKLRAEGVQRLEKAKSLMASDPNKALAQAKIASAIFRKYEGQNDQLADAYEQMGRANRKLNNRTVALNHYRSANDLEATGARARAIKELTPRRTRLNQQKRPSQPTAAPRLDLDDGVPDGERTYPKGPSTVVVRPQPPTAQPPATQNPRPRPQPSQAPYKPNYEQKYDETKERPGDRGVLDTYNTSRSNSSPPGLR